MESLESNQAERIPPRRWLFTLSDVVEWTGGAPGKGQAKLTDGTHVSRQKIDFGVHWTQDKDGDHWRGTRRRTVNGIKARELDPGVVATIMAVETILAVNNGEPQEIPPQLVAEINSLTDAESHL